MKVEFQGGPADGMRDEAPDDISEIYLTDVGPAGEGSDPFNSSSLGHMTYKITRRAADDGAVIFQFAGSTPDAPLEIHLKMLRDRTASDGGS